MLEKLKAKTLSSQDSTQLIERAVQVLRSRFDPISRIYLFGSAARGEMTDLSDLDFLITVPTDDDVKPARKAFAAVTLEIGWPLDLLIYSDADFDRKSQIGGVCFDAFHEGQCLSW